MIQTEIEKRLTTQNRWLVTDQLRKLYSFYIVRLIAHDGLLIPLGNFFDAFVLPTEFALRSLLEEENEF